MRGSELFFTTNSTCTFYYCQSWGIKSRVSCMLGNAISPSSTPAIIFKWVMQDWFSEPYKGWGVDILEGNTKHSQHPSAAPLLGKPPFCIFPWERALFQPADTCTVYIFSSSLFSSFCRYDFFILVFLFSLPLDGYSGNLALTFPSSLTQTFTTKGFFFCVCELNLPCFNTWHFIVYSSIFPQNVNFFKVYF